MKIVRESILEYLEGERQEGQRWRSPDQVDYPLAEEDDEKKTVKHLEGDSEVVEVEEDINPAAMEAGIRKIYPKDYTKKQL